MFRKLKFSVPALALLVMFGVTTVFGAILSIPFFSQIDPAWSGQKMGATQSTIGPKGCATTSVAMLLRLRGADVDPGKLNAWLNKNGGYTSDLSLDWSKAVKYNGTQWLTYDGRGTLGSLAEVSKQLANRKLIIAQSTRYPSHFVVIRGVTPDGKVGYY